MTKEEQEYTKLLETWVCFLSNCYVACKRNYRDSHTQAARDESRDLTKKEFDEILRFPLIQGTFTMHSVEKLAALHQSLEATTEVIKPLINRRG